MKSNKIFRGIDIRVFSVVMSLAICICPIPAHADLIIAAQSVSVNASTTGDSLDITLTNNGSSSFVVAGFSFEVSAASPNITFTSATTSTTNAYIFDSNSSFGPTLSTTAAGQTLDASDIFSIMFSGTTIAPNATFGLGHLLFDVGADSGMFALTLSLSPATSLSDQNGNDLPFALSNGQIDVTGGTAVPEPSSMILLATGIAAVSIRRARLRCQTFKKKASITREPNHQVSA